MPYKEIKVGWLVFLLASWTIPAVVLGGSSFLPSLSTTYYNPPLALSLSSLFVKKAAKKRKNEGRGGSGER